MKRSFSVLFLLALLTLPTIAAPVARPAPIMNAAEIGLALQKLNVLGTALYLAAHPDDENTAMISWLSKERQLRTGYLAITRGDGGQNLIGDEKGSGLGVIRTQELLAARSIDGGQQFFTRAIDFGYTKSPEESMKVWGHDEILADVTRVIRTFRPDVVITRFPTNGGGHGQHTASAIFAVEAFDAAADPSRFPEQLAAAGPWQIQRLYWDDYRPFFGRRDREPDLSKDLRIDVGAYNSRLGRSYTEIAGAARSMHKTQGFGAARRRGSLSNYLLLTKGSAATGDPFAGLDLTWNRVPGGDRVRKLVDEAIRGYDPSHPEASIPGLTRILDALDGLEQGHWVRIKRDEVREIIRSCSGLWLEAIAEDFSSTPGSTVKIRLTSINRSSAGIRLISVTSPWASWHEEPKVLEPNTPVQIDLEVAIPVDASISQPYWLHGRPTGGRYVIESADLAGRAENDPALSFEFQVEIGGRLVSLDVPVLYRRVDPVRGELYRPFVIEPALSIEFDEPIYLFPDGNPRDVRVSVRSGEEGVSGSVGLTPPTGWSAEPQQRTILRLKKGDETLLSFRLTPQNGKGVHTLSAWAESDGTRYDLSRHSISYDHIPPQIWYSPAEARLVREDLNKRGTKLGYVEGSGDEIPDALRQVGYDIEMLGADTLAGGELDGYDSIVIGVRALNTREDLVRHYDRLLDYVKRGGTLVVQYTTTRNLPDTIGPWPMQISHDRITEEDSPMTFVRDEPHSLKSEPNRIVASDFDGWVQERGLYFASEWDDHYEPILVGHDTGEEPLEGGLLYSRYGKGVFIYTGISFFRQLPAGVPGAYKLFLNLVSAR